MSSPSQCLHQQGVDCSKVSVLSPRKTADRIVQCGAAVFSSDVGRRISTLLNNTVSRTPRLVCFWSGGGGSAPDDLQRHVFCYPVFFRGISRSSLVSEISLIRKLERQGICLLSVHRLEFSR